MATEFDKIEVSKKGSKKSIILEGTITSIDRIDNTANVEIPYLGVIEEIPFHYHCGNEVNVDNSYKAFFEDDEVLVLNTTGEIEPVKEDLKIIAFADGLPRECIAQQYIIISHRGYSTVYCPETNSVPTYLPGKGGGNFSFPVLSFELDQWRGNSKIITSTDPYHPVVKDIGCIGEYIDEHTYDGVTSWYHIKTSFPNCAWRGGHEGELWIYVLESNSWHSYWNIDMTSRTDYYSCANPGPEDIPLFSFSTTCIGAANGEGAPAWVGLMTGNYQDILSGPFGSLVLNSDTEVYIPQSSIPEPSQYSKGNVLVGKIAWYIAASPEFIFYADYKLQQFVSGERLQNTNWSGSAEVSEADMVNDAGIKFLAKDEQASNIVPNTIPSSNVLKQAISNLIAESNVLLRVNASGGVSTFSGVMRVSPRTYGEMPRTVYPQFTVVTIQKS